MGAGKCVTSCFPSCAPPTLSQREKRREKNPKLWWKILFSCWTKLLIVICWFQIFIISFAYFKCCNLCFLKGDLIAGPANSWIDVCVKRVRRQDGTHTVTHFWNARMLSNITHCLVQCNKAELAWWRVLVGSLCKKAEPLLTPLIQYFNRYTYYCVHSVGIHNGVLEKGRKLKSKSLGEVMWQWK